MNKCACLIHSTKAFQIFPTTSTPSSSHHSCHSFMIPPGRLPPKLLLDPSTYISSSRSQSKLGCKHRTVFFMSPPLFIFFLAQGLNHGCASPNHASTCDVHHT